MPKVVRIIARLNVGGPAIHTILLAQRLRPAYDTVLVSGLETAAEGDMLGLAERLGVPVVRIPELGREINLAGDAMALLKLRALIRRERPDIVHTHTAKAGLLGRLAARWCRVPVVVHTFHGHVFRGYFGPRQTRLFLAMERALALMTDRILTVNQQQRGELIGYRIASPAKILAMRLGLDLEPLATSSASGAAVRAKWRIPPEAPLVGIVARLVPVKGHELFLDAAAEIQRHRPDIHFAVIGDGERRAELEAYAKAHGARVIFTGWETDLPEVYAALDAVCLTSLNEGSPVALIEALTAGKPVVSTAAGGVVDLIQDGETGLLVRERNAGDFAAALLRVLDSPREAQAMGSRGRAAVYPAYDIGRLAADMDALYRDLLSRKRTAG
ncbi:MAG: glycosyltransferase family 4 protein [Chloroflexota bacterium]|nr:glycosyltransferase family 4 protein [Chloroflexota bacterium]